jgi:hypothetical protein
MGLLALVMPTTTIVLSVFESRHAMSSWDDYSSGAVWLRVSFAVQPLPTVAPQMGLSWPVIDGVTWWSHGRSPVVDSSAKWIMGNDG